MFGQSGESIQFEKLYQEDETSNSTQEESQKPVLFPDKQLESFQDETAVSAADIVLHSETEARLEQELFSEIEEKIFTEDEQKINSEFPEISQKNFRNQAVNAVNKRHGVLSYR